MADNLSTFTGLYIPSTQVWDVSQIADVNINSPEFRELLIRMYQNINSIALAINLKDSGYYNTIPFINSQQFFPNPANTSLTDTAPTFRPVTRLVVNFGALPNAGTKSVPHGLTLTSATTATRIYGAASDTTGKSYIPLPYASPTLINNIELNIDGTNVNVTTGSNRTNYTVCYIVFEFLSS